MKWGERKQNSFVKIVLLKFINFVQLIETDGIPEEVKNSTGIILLGHMANGSENLDIGMKQTPFLRSCCTLILFFFFQDNSLASGFRIDSGNMTVRIPLNIPARDDYFVVCE